MKEAILAVNAASIAILLFFTALLLATSRYHGARGWAALVTFVPTVPVYLYNFTRMMGWHGVALFMFPISFSVNTLLMPLLWLFARINFDPDFRWRPVHLLHFLPAIVFLVLGLLTPEAQKMNTIRYEMGGDDTWYGEVNTMLVSLQILVYYPAIFIYLYRKKKAIADTTSDAEWVQKLWIPRFMILFFVLFVIVMVCYEIWPRTDAWLIQIINVISMTYLVYCALTNQSMPLSATDEMPKEQDAPAMSIEQMRKVCDAASEYLAASKAYLKPDISLALFSKEANISQRTLSRAINGYLKINFFEFINRMRVEEAKQKLMDLETSGYNIDSIYEECGFRSRSSFFMVFKKIEGMSPAAWLENRNKHAS